MYRVEKKFSIPIGHRLSKHDGRCHSIHGHNFTILVGVKSKILNTNDMIIDFADLRRLVNIILDDYDHSLLVNKKDSPWMTPLAKELGLRARVFDRDHDYDPTAERLSEQLFKMLKEILAPIGITTEYVTVFENENSKATYTEE